MKSRIIYLLLIAACGLAAYGIWNITRTINYALSYEDMVEETVCSMIKPEHLKKPCK